MGNYLLQGGIISVSYTHLSKVEKWKEDRLKSLDEELASKKQAQRLKTESAKKDRFCRRRRGGHIGKHLTERRTTMNETTVTTVKAAIAAAVATMTALWGCCLLYTSHHLQHI